MDLRMKKVLIDFEISNGKFKPIIVMGEVEDVEYCGICEEGRENGDLIKKRCYYLSNKECDIYLQICSNCFKKIKSLSTQVSQKAKSDNNSFIQDCSCYNHSCDFCVYNKCKKISKCVYRKRSPK